VVAGFGADLSMTATWGRAPVGRYAPAIGRRPEENASATSVESRSDDRICIASSGVSADEGEFLSIRRPHRVFAFEQPALCGAIGSHHIDGGLEVLAVTLPSLECNLPPVGRPIRGVAVLNESSLLLRGDIEHPYIGSRNAPLRQAALASPSFERQFPTVR
jgi:hypothetical protein